MSLNSERTQKKPVSFRSVLRERSSSLFLLLVAAGMILSAQSQAQTGSSGQAEVINLFATVRDKHGKIVSNLTKEDFVLNQDDRPQTIQSFARETDLPLTVGLLFQTSRTEAGALDRERSASHDFLDQMLRENKDKAFIIHFDREVELLQDLTPSRDKLFNALGLLQATQLDQDGGDNSGGPGERRGGHSGYGNVLYDAIYLASNELMKTQHDRKILIVISDGVDRHSKETVGSAVESAQRTDTLVYTLLSKGEQPQSQGGFGFPGSRSGMGRQGGGGRRYPQEQRPDGKKMLEQISTETGGGFFEVSKKQPISQIYNTIQEDLHHQYSLAYKADKSGDWSGYHKILLTTKQKDLEVQARQGFYAGQ
jgi:VWFA-related protein